MVAPSIATHERLKESKAELLQRYEEATAKVQQMETEDEFDARLGREWRKVLAAAQLSEELTVAEGMEKLRPRLAALDYLERQNKIQKYQ